MRFKPILVFFLSFLIFTIQNETALADKENLKFKSITSFKNGPCPERRRTLRAPKDFLRMGSPLENTPVNLRLGEALYHLDAKPSCKSCHGVRGNGLGAKGKGMNPPPRNFSCKHTMKEISDGQMFWIIRKGSSNTPMPAYEDLYDEQIWQLILYIRHFSK